MLLSYGVGLVISIVAAIQIATQIFFAPEPEEPAPSCAEGVRELARSVLRARSAVDPDLDENDALERFRATVARDFARLPALRRVCRGSASDERALDAIERLRYAEEHAVRREASELASLRRAVRALLGDGRAPEPGGTPPR